MTYEQFSQAVHADRIPPILLLHGEEGYLVEQAARQVTAAVVAADSRDFNLTVVHGRDLKGNALIDQARTLPVFASRRLVVIRNVHEAQAEQLEAFSAYLDDPVPETFLLVTATTIDKRRKFFQKFAQVGEIIEFRRLYENQLPQFIRDRAREAGRTFTGPALKLFCRRVGNNLAEVVGELDKLASYVGDREFFEEDDVAAVVSDTRVESVFALTDALGTGELAVALRLLGRLLDDGQPALVILSMLTRHFRQLWKARELLAQGVPQKDLPRRIGVNPYFLSGLLVQARNCSDDQLREAFPKFLAVDLSLKSGGDSRAQLEGLVFALCAAGPPAGKK
ncbi:MAG: DNA polymerase III subunit delta [Desulfuromonadales bacterium]|nr:DNA polymerase III subunit delta [Desulfuromonadales bacterium]